MDQRDLFALAERYPTPFYLFDAGELTRRVDHLRSVLPPDTGLCYAVKANPFLARELSALAERLEICSPGEYAICRQLGLPPSQYVISGVYKDPRWVEELMARGDVEEMLCTVESMAQYRLLRKGALDHGRRLKLLLRLTSGSQFGLELEEIREILAQPHPLLHIQGLQYFSGTQKSSLKRLDRELRLLEEVLARLQADFGPLEELELGPGFPVSYFDDDGEQDEAFLVQAAQRLARLDFAGALTLELGRSMAASCGSYVTRVVDRKRNQGQNYAILDGGIHQLVYYGQSMAMRRPPVALFPPRPEQSPEPWNLCGALCTVNDILVKQLPLPALEIGDLLAFGKAGAYCMTEGIGLFLSRELPQILLRRPDGTVCSLREPFPTGALNTPNYDEKVRRFDGTAAYHFERDPA